MAMQIVKELDKWSGASSGERQWALMSYLKGFNTEPARGTDEPGQSQSDPKAAGKRHCKEVEDLIEQLSKGGNKAKSDGEDEHLTQGLPDGIPLSQWDQILRGESVNFNQFFASKHFPDGKQQVRNGSDWSAAFRKAKRAITFLFPHWQEELDKYKEHIEDLFATKQDSAHG
ncbi:unnamed protein product [Cyclocybe aegerita]|uniref:Uncharacterized protein n=1 Tax=Cyclocybe aegerita TaxID=1973307 RepID=A0A8S0X547_CYCAE|nr:unnamed protein product [Cyclocybe aegerita]